MIALFCRQNHLFLSLPAQTINKTGFRELSLIMTDRGAEA